MFVHQLVRFLGACAFLAAIAPAAEWQVHAEWNREGLVRFTTERDQIIAGPEPIVRWQTSTPKLLRDSGEIRNPCPDARRSGCHGNERPPCRPETAVAIKR